MRNLLTLAFMSLVGLSLACTSAQANPHGCRSGSAFSDLERISSSAGGISDEVYDSCAPQISAKDRDTLAAIRKELAALTPAWQGEAGRAYKAKVDSVIRKYEKKLSPGATRRLIADSNKQLVDKIVSSLGKSPQLSKKYLTFAETSSWYKKQRSKFMHGFWDNVRGKDQLADEDKKLDQAYQELVAEIKTSRMDENTRRVLSVAVHQAAGDAYAMASKEANTNAKRASVGMAAAGAILTADLAVASWITGGLAAQGTASAAAGTASAIGGVFWTTASGAASGAAAGGGLAGAKIVGSALLKTKRREGNDFFCRLAQEVEDKGATYVHDSLVGAVLGSAFGVTAGVASKVLVGAKKAIGVSMAGLGALNAGKDGAEVYDLDRQAREAERAGDRKTAAELLEKRNEKALHLGLDVASIGAGGLLAMKGKTVPATRSSRSPDEILAVLKKTPSTPKLRQSLAAELLGQEKLSGTAMAAIEKAHLIAPGKGYGEHSVAELNAKMDVLVREGGLLREDAAKLVRAGICGNAEGAPVFITHGEEGALKEVERQLSSKSRFQTATVQQNVLKDTGALTEVEARMSANQLDKRDVGALYRITKLRNARAEARFAQNYRTDESVAELSKMKPFIERMDQPDLMKGYFNSAYGEGDSHYNAFYELLKNASHSGVEEHKLSQVLQAGLKFKEFQNQRSAVLESMENLIQKENAILTQKGDHLDKFRAYKNAELRVELFRERSLDSASEKLGRPPKDWDEAYDVLSDDPAWATKWSSYLSDSTELKKLFNK